MKNLSAHASVAQLVALFSRFESEGGPPVLYRLLAGRMKGQAFITLPGEKHNHCLLSVTDQAADRVTMFSHIFLADAETAQRALQLLHGYRGLGKPLVIEFSRERQDGGKPDKEVQKEKQF